MKFASLIVALTLSMFAGTPARPAAVEPTGLAAPLARQVVAAPAAVGGDEESPSAKGDEAVPQFGASTFVWLAIGLFGMGLVSRRRQPD